MTQGLWLMLVGMSTVFVFLIALVGAMHVTARIAALFPEPAPVPRSPNSNDDELVAVAIAAAMAMRGEP